jgi:hypothetical protein
VGRHSSEDTGAETALLPVARPRPTRPAWLPGVGVLVVILVVLTGAVILVVSRSGGGRARSDDPGGQLAVASRSADSSGSPPGGLPGSPPASSGAGPSGAGTSGVGPSSPAARPSATAPARAGTGTGLTVAFRQSDNWPGGYQAGYTITNHGTVPVSGWAVAVTFSGSGDFQWWDVDGATGTNHQIIFTAKSYNSTVPAGGSVTFGLIVKGSPPPTPTVCTVNGRSC